MSFAPLLDIYSYKACESRCLLFQKKCSSITRTILGQKQKKRPTKFVPSKERCGWEENCVNPQSNCDHENSSFCHQSLVSERRQFVSNLIMYQPEYEVTYFPKSFLYIQQQNISLKWDLQICYDSYYLFEFDYKEWLDSLKWSHNTEKSVNGTSTKYPHGGHNCHIVQVRWYIAPGFTEPICTYRITNFTTKLCEVHQ